jgi:TPR repeat protein
MVARWQDSQDFYNCKSGDLEPLNGVWTLADSDRDRFKALLASKARDEFYYYALDHSQRLNDDIPEEQRDKEVMFLFRQAAEQGSVSAMNEIGASLLYCYQGVAQDQTEAQIWLEQAAAGGDSLAMYSLARMHLAGMTKVSEPEAVAMELFQACSKAGFEECETDLAALEAAISISK